MKKVCEIMVKFAYIPISDKENSDTLLTRHLATTDIAKWILLSILRLRLGLRKVKKSSPRERLGGFKDHCI